MADLPVDFVFSQNNLQDFVDCPRRFELRHLLRQPWPAVQSEPVLEHERHMQRGELFHQMIHQHQVGLPADVIGRQAMDEELKNWWDSYLAMAPAALPEKRYPEFTLRAGLAGHIFLAKFDLLCIDPGTKIVIVDWKTGQKKTNRSTLRARLQTRLYPWMAVKAGAYLNGNRPVLPEMVEMIYWFTAEPLHTENFSYSAAQFQKDEKLLTDLVDEVERDLESGFPLTGDEHKCVYCNYRSLCDRGIFPGKEDDPDYRI